MLRRGCCTIFQPDTGLSHTYPISPLLLLSVVPLSPTNARRSSLLFLHVSPARSSIPLAFVCLLLFPPLCHCCSVSFTPLPSPCAESICSSADSLLLSFFPLLSAPLWLCLPLPHPRLLPWIHAFHVGTFLSIPQSSELHCAYLAV